MTWFVPFEVEKINLGIPYSKFMENLLMATGQNRNPLQKSAVRNLLRGYTLKQNKRYFLIRARNKYLLSTRVRVKGKLLKENEVSLFYRPSNESVAIVSVLWFVFLILLIKCFNDYLFLDSVNYFWLLLMGTIFVFQLVQLQRIFNKLQKIRATIESSSVD